MARYPAVPRLYNKLKDNPEVVPRDAEAKAKASREKAAVTKVPNTKFISE